jgi:hypothetical protein
MQLDFLHELLKGIRRKETSGAHHWSSLELYAVLRGGERRLIWRRIERQIDAAKEQALAQGSTAIDRHFCKVEVQQDGRSHYDCILSGFGAYLLLCELSPTDEVRSARAYFIRYLSPAIAAPVDAPANPLVEVPALSLRDQINIAMRRYAMAYSIDYNEAWGQLYRQHYYRYKLDIKTRAKNAEQKTLDWAEQHGHLEQLLAIANMLYNSRLKTNPNLSPV